MSALLIRNVRLVRPGLDISAGDVLVRGGRIIAAGAVLRFLEQKHPGCEILLMSLDWE